MNTKKRTWFRLDNAAKIYPAFASKKDPATFRVAAVLKHPVNKTLLQSAVDMTLPNFPSMAVTLKRGLFWYYLDENPRKAIVKKETKRPCAYINLKESNGFLFQVVYYKTRIALECFHALTDGYGALEFLKALLYNYAIQMGEIPADSLRLHGTDEGDFEDSYKKYAGEDHQDSPKLHVKHIHGTDLHLDGIFVHHAKLDAMALNKCAKIYGVTITVLLTSIYMKSLLEVIGKGPITIAVPVNLRKIFPSKTLRNFSYVLNIPCWKDKSFRAMLEHVMNEFSYQLDEERLKKQFSKNVNYESKWLLRLTPNEVKSIFLRNARSKKSKKVVTSVLTNPGIIHMPEEMTRYIDYFEMMLYASKPLYVNMGICTYNNEMVISLSRGIKEKDIIELFFKNLEKYTQLDVEYYSNEGDE